MGTTVQQDGQDGNQAWEKIRDIAGELRRLYSPGDEKIGRCDIGMIHDAAVAGLEALEEEKATGPETDAVRALLRALQKVTRGLTADLREYADAAGELAEDLARVRGPS